MSPADDLWMQLVELDQNLDDRLWSDEIVPEDLPDWGRDVAVLIATARGPATDDEFADEPATVEAMREATLEADRRRRTPLTVPSRQTQKVVLKSSLKVAAAAGAALIGVTTAAAATGVGPSLLPDWPQESQPGDEVPAAEIEEDRGAPTTATSVAAPDDEECQAPTTTCPEADNQTPASPEPGNHASGNQPPTQDGNGTEPSGASEASDASTENEPPTTRPTAEPGPPDAPDTTPPSDPGSQENDTGDDAAHPPSGPPNGDPPGRGGASPGPPDHAQGGGSPGNAPGTAANPRRGERGAGAPTDVGASPGGAGLASQQRDLRPRLLQ